MFWRVSPYDNRVVHLQHDEESVAHLANRYSELIFFEAELVCT